MKTLNQKQNRLLLALLTEPTKKQAAEKAGVTYKTLVRYMKDVEFKSAYQAALAEMVEDAVAQGKQSLNPALSTLREIAEDNEQQAQARVSAARSLIEYTMRLNEQADILEQLRELEKWREETDGKR